MKPEQELRFLKIMELGLNELGAADAALDLRKLHDEVEAALNARGRLCRCGDERYKHKKEGGKEVCIALHNPEDSLDGQWATPCSCTGFEAAP